MNTTAVFQFGFQQQARLIWRSASTAQEWHINIKSAFVERKPPEMRCAEKIDGHGVRIARKGGEQVVPVP